MAEIETRIAELVEPSLIGLGFDLVRVQFAQGTLQIMAEKADNSQMTVEDCADISHTVSALLDVSDPIKTQYVLEVSSPGLDRPLTRISDYERFANERARIDMKLPVDGCKRFQGLLKGANGLMVRVQLEGGSVVELPFENIRQARLDISREVAKAQPKPGKAKAGAKKAAANGNGKSGKRQKKSNGEVES